MPNIKELFNNNNLAVVDADDGKVVVKEIVTKNDSRSVNYYIWKDVDYTINIGDIKKIYHNVVLGTEGMIYLTRHNIIEYVKISDDVKFFVDTKLEEFKDQIINDVKFGAIPDEVAVYIAKHPQLSKLTSMIDVNAACAELSTSAYIMAVIYINKGLRDKYLGAPTTQANTNTNTQQSTNANNTTVNNTNTASSNVAPPPNIPPINLSSI